MLETLVIAVVIVGAYMLGIADGRLDERLAALLKEKSDD